MAMSKRAIDEILARHGYRAVSGGTDADSPTAAAETSSPPLDSLRRRYADGSPAPPLLSPLRSGEDAIVVAEPLDGRSPRKVFVLSADEDDVVGEQG
jgi:hypothetical protein